MNAASERFKTLQNELVKQQEHTDKNTTGKFCHCNIAEHICFGFRTDLYYN